MIVGGVNVSSPWFGSIPVRVNPPSAPSPDQLTVITGIFLKDDEGLEPNLTEEDSPGFLSHVDPIVGVVGLIIGIGRAVHPGLRVGGFLIAVGLAVINWGSAPAGAGSVDYGGATIEQRIEAGY